ncbi:hypothetical protein SDRG_15902 [Saprolegnia diclina VS20]|uniref:Uncharacterized protein n=1 Tax=Saprolegnia diclina (strain VS20) TaxID=1156394 RepID=T0PVE2_SAPDV|nr:hypothetical protein SDRG_15902 [Saprolegnia diclina VS20]EQC26241.1 hypothetical protein SDRG_15902 [Saprolegnia diclina VS20]|eukprot:XP_008620310.1 hypothetical protein SDRG_15902 [Saprolegnia diclina VS20]
MSKRPESVRLPAQREGHGDASRHAGLAVASPSLNRPDDSRWSQQTLPTWKPILTLWWTIVILFASAIGCLVLGILICRSSSQLSVYRVLYDGPDQLDATQEDGSVAHLSNCHVSSPADANSFSGQHTCYVTIRVTKDFVSDGHLYYELDPFYQNHRRLVASQEPSQLMDIWAANALGTTNCDPLVMVTSTACFGTVCNGSEQLRQLYPCGLVSNTMFNDIFWLHNGSVPNGPALGHSDLTHEGIAKSFLTYNVKNPSGSLDLATYLPIWHNPNYSRIVPMPDRPNPPSITPDYSNSTAWTTTAPPGTGLENEWFRVWIDITATPMVRKLYGRIAQAKLRNGTELTFAVQSNFFSGGTKSLVLAELAWYGSENKPLGVAFVVVGVFCALAALVFFARALRNPRKLGDVSALKWKLH